MPQISGFMSGLLAMLIVGSAAAQTNYPDKPIRLLVGVPAGSQTDIVARLLAQKLAEAWGKPVIVENRTGAAGSIAVERVSKAAPDGYTLGVMSLGQLAIDPNLRKLPYHPIKDFAPVSELFVSTSLLVVHNAVRAKNVKELIALAKAQRGELTYASAGVGSASHMSTELFKSAAGVDIRNISYKGLVDAIPDLLSGRLTMMFLNVTLAYPLARDGKLRALAVASSKRWPSIPDVPTVAESGVPNYDHTSWNGLLAPAGTPASIIVKINQETTRTLALPDVRAKLDGMGLEGAGNSPAEFTALIKSENTKWAKVIKDSGITPD
jgi:tripartite-type tricarboxylate transporter receptor subunit TctC